MINMMKNSFPSFPAPDINQLNSVNVGSVERVMSLVVGGFMAYKGASKLKKNPISGALTLGASAYLFYRGISGNCVLKPPKHNAASRNNLVRIEETLIVRQRLKEVYEYWRRLGNLAAFMKHLKRVQEVNAIQSVWEAYVPGHFGTIQWEAEVVTDVPYQLLGWKSVAGAVVENSGFVSFSETRNNGTLLHVVIEYRPPAGKLGNNIARLLNPVFEKIVRNDINHFAKHFEQHTAHENNLTTYSRM